MSEPTCAFCSEVGTHACPGGVVHTDQYVYCYPAAERDARSFPASSVRRDKLGQAWRAEGRRTA